MLQSRPRRNTASEHASVSSLWVRRSAWEASKESLGVPASPTCEIISPTKLDTPAAKDNRERVELALGADINADCDQSSRQGRTHGNPDLTKTICKYRQANSCRPC